MMVSLLTIMLLLVVFEIKHFVADFLLQGKYMLGKFKPEGWIMPLLAHVGVHGIMTLVIVFFATYSVPMAIILALLDMSIHFVMDRVKASPELLGRYKIDDKRFWWSLGFDQMVHNLTNYLIIFIILV